MVGGNGEGPGGEGPGGEAPGADGLVAPRPRGLAELLDLSVALYRDGFGELFTIAGVAAGVEALAYTMLHVVLGPAGGGTFAPPPGAPEVPVSPLMSAFESHPYVLPLTAFLYLWSSAALVHAIGRIGLGETVDWRSSYRATLGRLPALAVTTILLGLVLAGSFGGVTLLFLGAGVVGAIGPLAGFGMALLSIGFLAIGLTMALGIWLHAETVVLERCSVVAALSRSRTLMRYRYGPGLAGRADTRLGLVLTVGSLGSSAVQILGLLPAAVIGAAAVNLGLAHLDDPSSIASWLQLPVILGGRLGQALVLPWTTCLAVLFYQDLRCRAEGLDLKLRALRLTT